MKMNLPNKLTMLRILMIPVFVVFMLLSISGDYSIDALRLAAGAGPTLKTDGEALAAVMAASGIGDAEAVAAAGSSVINSFVMYRYAAFTVFCLACLTDFLDGRIARKYHLITDFGKFMDPLADKLLVCSALILLTAEGSLSCVVVIVIIAREFIISGFRLIAADNGIVIAASWWGKFKTTAQMILCIVLILPVLPVMLGSLVINILTFIAAALTIISLVDYMAKNIKVITDGGM